MFKKQGRCSDYPCLKFQDLMSASIRIFRRLARISQLCLAYEYKHAYRLFLRVILDANIVTVKQRIQKSLNNVDSKSLIFPHDGSKEYGGSLGGKGTDEPEFIRPFRKKEKIDLNKAPLPSINRRKRFAIPGLFAGKRDLVDQNASDLRI